MKNWASLWLDPFSFSLENWDGPFFVASFKWEFWVDFFLRLLLLEDLALDVCKDAREWVGVGSAWVEVSQAEGA
ncbi:unnamed protein product [Prunus armeniaca]|uniref:Uncharacterized protein n=1 Tax=Prunus armeniaca TaxID=36596 RepID=A0A6J5Y728_PRUAR|nr:unnamed protein product [Prunus armeniaca]